MNFQSKFTDIINFLVKASDAYDKHAVSIANNTYFSWNDSEIQALGQQSPRRNKLRNIRRQLRIFLLDRFGQFDLEDALGYFSEVHPVQDEINICGQILRKDANNISGKIIRHVLEVPYEGLETFKKAFNNNHQTTRLPEAP